MCDPVSLGVASLVVGVAGAGMSAYSQYQSAQYNAQVARNNQTIAQQNSSIALQQGQTQEENQRLKTGGMVAGIEAQQAASGVNANTGSSVDVRSSAAETGELDALTIRYNSNLQARNFTQAANSYGAQASLDEAQGEWGVAGSILGGASSVSGKWLQYQQSGVGAGTSLPSSYYNLPSFNVGG